MGEMTLAGKREYALARARLARMFGEMYNDSRELTESAKWEQAAQEIEADMQAQESEAK
mgnify:CR=1 FL=1